MNNYFLQETGDKIILEDDSGFILLEDATLAALSATPFTRAIKASVNYMAERALFRSAKLASARRTAKPDQ